MRSFSSEVTLTMAFLDSAVVVHQPFVTFTFAIQRNVQTEAISVLLHLHVNAIRLPIARE